MESSNCTNCGKLLNDGDWKSKSGLCRACAEESYNNRNRPKYVMWIVIVACSMAIVWVSACAGVFVDAWG